MATLTHVELITPERVLFSGEAEAVMMRTDGGDITFLANHMDYIGALDVCVVRIDGIGAAPAGDVVPAEHAGEQAAAERAPQRLRAAAHGGFVMVTDNTVTVAAGVAELAEEIDVPRAQRALEAAETAAQFSEEVDEAVARARVRLDAAAAVGASAISL